MNGFAVLLAALSPAARADVVVLSTDVFMEGIVIDETATDVKLQVSDSGYAMYSKETLLDVVYDPAGTNSALRKRWRLDAERGEREREEREDEMSEEPAEEPKAPLPLLGPQPPIQVIVHVDAPASPGVGVIVSPASVANRPFDRFAPRPLFNRRQPIGPSLMHGGRQGGPSPGNIHVNR